MLHFNILRLFLVPSNLFSCKEKSLQISCIPRRIYYKEDLNRILSTNERVSHICGYCLLLYRWTQKGFVGGRLLCTQPIRQSARLQKGKRSDGKTWANLVFKIISKLFKIQYFTLLLRIHITLIKISCNVIWYTWLEQYY